MTNRPISPAAAVALQKELAPRLVLSGKPPHIDLVAGVDVSSHGRGAQASAGRDGCGDPSSLGNTSYLVGAVAVWSISERRVIASATAVREAEFPYIPGLLAFRELPVLLEAFNNLTRRRGDAEFNQKLRDSAGSARNLIDAIICDGQGIAHPRGMGIACHIGLELGIPAVGCGKTKLVGEYDPPPDERGAASPLVYKGREVGRVVRTRPGVSPVFISPGHLMGLNESVELAMLCVGRYRLPEPIRAAHKLAGEVSRAEIAGTQSRFS